MYHRTMNWIDDRLNEDKELHDREEAITTSAPTIYDDIWDCIVADVNYAYSTKKIPLSTSGASYHRVVTMSDYSGEAKKLHYKLSPDRRSIIVEGSNMVSGNFVLSVGRDGVVHPTNQHGDELTNAEMARRILDPFLFPHLQRRK
jgi:hypothetical protein